jgi:hypothetical protein
MITKSAQLQNWRVGLVWVDSPEIPVTMQQTRQIVEMREEWKDKKPRRIETAVSRP